jgi:hypothetical protein
MIVLALAILGAPVTATAAELRLGGHSYRSVHHWHAHHAPRVHFGYYWYQWGWRWGRHPVFLVRLVVRLGVIIDARGLTTAKVRVADPSQATCVLSQTSYGCSN